MDYRLPLFFLVLFSTCGYSIYRLMKNADFVHGKLNGFRTLAESCQFDHELHEIRRQLVAFHNKECWHRHYGDHTREVLSYINGRLKSS